MDIIFQHPEVIRILDEANKQTVDINLKINIVNCIIDNNIILSKDGLNLNKNMYDKLRIEARDKKINDILNENI